MTKLNMDNVRKIEQDLQKDVDYVISHYLQERKSSYRQCTEEEMAMACQLVRQKNRQRVQICYHKYEYSHIDKRYSYDIKNITLND